jgi:hypothetical protein
LEGGVSAPTEAYPLCWPPGRRREGCKEFARFKTTLGLAIFNIRSEVKRLGGTELVISSNLMLRRDGLPMATGPKVTDHGVAVYFTLKKKPMCFASDRWRFVEDNMQAIAKTIEALRGIERWGSGQMVEQAFTGFIALPAPEQPWQVLGIAYGSSRDVIQNAWRRLASDNHPDKGGDSNFMARINAARDALLQELT